MKNKIILVCEDEPSLRGILDTKLSNMGYAVKVANNGTQALDNLPADLILLDLLMPVMNGLDFLKELRSRGDNTPVIVLTNFNPEEEGSQLKLGENVPETLRNLGVVKSLIKSNTGPTEIAKLVGEALA